DGDPLPPQLGGEWTVSYQMDAAALLNYYKGILPLSGLARLTGINQRQLAHYAAGRSRPRAGQAAKIEDALHRLGQELQGVKVLV
ncbi:MAG TPA: helix-turn-helix domain-containing protein, partial [Candidatus Avibacteroides avistercoris]|nr:helix-turn-helix domain-containing protein [Candidatus Avibacteroides avistercoris]